ncbi:MAG: sensor histidine kinase [Leeuwenhoekiella sp.]
MWTRFIKLFLSLFIPILILTTVWEYLQRESQINEFVQAEKRATDYKKSYFLDLLQYLVYSSHNWSNVKFPMSFSPTGQDSLMMKPYLQFIEGSSDYEQFRFINMQGQEILRYERGGDGKMQREPLQDKSERQYFKEGITLKNDEIYVSEINLNEEYGKIEYPLNPVVRCVSPIYDVEGNQLGLAVINFRMLRILEELRKTVAASDFYLIDEDLNIITSNRGADPLSYQLTTDSLLVPKKYDTSKAWETPLVRDTAFYSNQNIVAISTIDLAESFNNPSTDFGVVDRIITPTTWAVVHQITPELLQQRLGGLNSAYYLINLIAALMTGLIAYLLMRKRAEREKLYDAIEDKNRVLLESKKAIESGYQEVKRVNNTLKVRNQQLKDFNYLVSHNLRAPVTSMSALVDMLEESDDEAETKTLLPKLVQVSSNIISLTDDITTYVSILDEDNETLEPINIKQMIETVQYDFSEILIPSDFEIRYDLKSWKIIDFSKFYLNSILRNFISNAIKYRKTGGASYMLFETAWEDGRKVLYVRDNGLGIDMERNRENLFKLHKRFHRGFSGKGMGLFLIKSHLNALGAQIEASSTVDEGTSFKIIFR